MYTWTREGQLKGALELMHSICQQNHCRIWKSAFGDDWGASVAFTCKTDIYDYEINYYSSAEEAQKDISQLFGIQEAL